ncbi:hypothetical protein M2351_005622 [Azospirillum canadense]|nr:hypothetical protein [Azospirillum canadense]
MAIRASIPNRVNLLTELFRHRPRFLFRQMDFVLHEGSRHLRKARSRALPQASDFIHQGHFIPALGQAHSYPCA